MNRPGRTVLALAATWALAACGGTADVVGGSPAPVTETPTTGPPAVTAAPTTTITTTRLTTVPPVPTTSTASSTTTTTTTIPVPVEPGVLDLDQDVVGLGFSVEGRPIVAERFGTPGGRRVLVIGVIHGNEDDGVAIVDRLRSLPAPEGVELWLVESVNPDGQARRDRHNANEVDLNRNFPHDWGPIGEPGFGQYAGTGPASEPETRLTVNFIRQLRPDISIWYHQDANLIIPGSGREGRVRARYAELTGLPIADCCDGGIYTGIAATWTRNELADLDAVSFIVELGEELSADEAEVHARAVLTIAADG